MVGRKASLFSDTIASINLYSLLQTCAVNGIDGYRYLSEMQTALPKAKAVEDDRALLPRHLTPIPN